jgi:hypothetical protein
LVWCTAVDYLYWMLQHQYGCNIYLMLPCHATSWSF